MRYISTRGQAPTLSFNDVLLTGLARDGGLYVPQELPNVTQQDFHKLRQLSYPDLAASILYRFTQPDISLEILKDICHKAYRRFDHPAIVPLVQLDENVFVQELFHGPTFSFKDMAMQILGLLFEHVITQRQTNITIVGATSGDTGSAAIEAFRGRKNISIVILHPKGRTSDIQRKQMTTVTDANVTNIAVEGTFDDCQDMVKALFSDNDFNQEVHLAAVNSINWARIAAQIPYYVRASLLLGDENNPVSFAVPTGNFGNILASYTAKKMGLPIDRLCTASNRNNILERFFNHNDMKMEKVEPSLSPSMDIQVSSNFERLLFDQLHQDGETCRDIMQDFRKTGKMNISTHLWESLRENFQARKLTDAQTLKEISSLYEKTHYVADPHSAIGIATAQDLQKDGATIIAEATAHPAKFPDTIVKALGSQPSMPPKLAELFHKPEKFVTSPPSLVEIKKIIRQTIAATQ